ncbi:MAG: hypothetical protein J1E02_05620, partial [Coprobacter sp.]|nr:hypothetical protein [Coprobacter sp.]
EPRTHSLEGCCSIQLSYPTKPFIKKRCKVSYLYRTYQIFTGNPAGREMFWGCLPVAFVLNKIFPNLVDWGRFHNAKN